MKKRLVVAVATSLIIANGSSVAMASGGSGDSSTTSTPSTTGARTPSNRSLNAAQRAAQQAAQRAQQAAQKAKREAEAKYRLELAQFLQTRRAINTAFSTAMVNAQREFKAARESATDRRSINIATRARLQAVQAATRTKNAALRELGAPPVKPARP